MSCLKLVTDSITVTIGCPDEYCLNFFFHQTARPLIAPGGRQQSSGDHRTNFLPTLPMTLKNHLDV